MTAILVLGMHRSGTSCLAGMLAGAKLASAGEAVRNWDNARGHHEMLDAVRLNEAVLAYSGGHYLAPPAEVRWTTEHAARRDALLHATIDGLPALIKDPRTLLVLPFWRDTAVPFRAIGIVRHPLAAARSMESWRGMPLGDGVALWTAHNRALAADRAQHGYPVLDFELPKPAFVDAVIAACGAADEAAYEEQLVHHDAAVAPGVPNVDEAVALYRALGGTGSATRAPFPREELARFARHVEARDAAAAYAAVRAAVAAVDDAAAVLVPAVSTLLRAGMHAAARTVLDAAPLEPGLAALLRGKTQLAAGDAPGAVAALEAACAVPHPLFQARHLLPHALRAAGRHAEARDALARVAREALYPHGSLATLAEWHWLDGDRDAARAGMRDAIAAAPPYRRGRLRTRLAEWLLAGADPAAARVELARAIEEDPDYPRSREVLATLR